MKNAPIEWIAPKSKSSGVQIAAVAGGILMMLGIASAFLGSEASNRAEPQAPYVGQAVVFSHPQTGEKHSGRIAAVEGDTVPAELAPATWPADQPLVVPRGDVYVLIGPKSKAGDSRDFGALPLSGVFTIDPSFNPPAQSSATGAISSYIRE